MTLHLLVELSGLLFGMRPGRIAVVIAESFRSILMSEGGAPVRMKAASRWTGPCVIGSAQLPAGLEGVIRPAIVTP
jgi:hypothetical protein